MADFISKITSESFDKALQGGLDSIEKISALENNKADLVQGKVPLEQLPDFTLTWN